MEKNLTQLEADELVAHLAHFSGTEQHHHTSLPRFYLTDGVAYLCEKARCYWLADAIRSYQGEIAAGRYGESLKEFQLWQLVVTPARSAYLTCRVDTDTPVRIQQRFRQTDFPLDTIELWVEAGATEDGETYRVLMLPQEH